MRKAMVSPFAGMTAINFLLGKLSFTTGKKTKRMQTHVCNEYKIQVIKEKSAKFPKGKLAKYLPADSNLVDEDIKNEFEKFPIETIEAFDTCGYEITELLTKRANDSKLLERIATITKEFNYEELRSVSQNYDGIYGIGEFITGTHEEIGIKSDNYIALLKKMIA